MEGIPTGCIVTAARCGHDATLLLTDGPLVLACGDNRSNRLGLNSTAFAFFRCKVNKGLILLFNILLSVEMYNKMGNDMAKGQLIIDRGFAETSQAAPEGRLQPRD